MEIMSLGEKIFESKPENVSVSDEEAITEYYMLVNFVFFPLRLGRNRIGLAKYWMVI